MIGKGSSFSTQDEASLNFWENLLLLLAMYSMLAPPAFQAIVTSLLAIWLVRKRGWRPTMNLIRSKNKYSPHFKKFLTILLWGLVISLFFRIFNLASELMILTEWSNFEIVKAHVKLAGKQGLWGFFLVMSLQYAVSRGWKLEQVVKPLTVGVLILTLYMIAQRYTGIHWVHGLSGTIPPNRFAYGVYRASGFMAHPLTMGYNCMLFTLLTFGLGRYHYSRQRKSSLPWYLLSFLGFICLLLTNSRFPILITLAVLGLPLLAWVLKSRRPVYLVLFCAVLGLGGYSIKDRMLELNNGTQSLKERIPRLVFWDVHWSMFLDEPLLGIGYIQKENLTEGYYDKLGYGDMERKYSAHNIYLQTLADSGIIGFLALLSILIALCRVSWLFWLNWKVPLLGIIVISTCMAGMMQNNLRDSEFLSALWLSLSIILVVIREQFIATGSQIKDIQP